MLDYQEVITEKVPASLTVFGSGYTIDHQRKKLERDIRAWYGLDWEEYASIRNRMLEDRGSMTMGELHHELVNRIVIDLTGRGFLRLKHASVSNVQFTLTEKAVDQVIMALSKKVRGLPKDPHQALIYLRNLNLLHD